MKQLAIRLLVAYTLVISVSLVLNKLSFGSKDNDYYGIYYGKNAPDFTLLDQNLSNVSLSQFRGTDILLSFGYTSCPNICPTTLSELNGVAHKLESSGDAPQIIFITVDPERDTPEHLKEYLRFFNETFIGLTGEPEDIRKVAESYSVFYEKEKSRASGDFYFMNHTQTVYLIDRGGNLLLVYPYDKLDPEKIASDIKRSIDNHAKTN